MPGHWLVNSYLVEVPSSPQGLDLFIQPYIFCPPETPPTKLHKSMCCSPSFFTPFLSFITSIGDMIKSELITANITLPCLSAELTRMLQHLMVPYDCHYLIVKHIIRCCYTTLLYLFFYSFWFYCVLVSSIRDMAHIHTTFQL